MKGQLERLIKEYRDLQPFSEDCKKQLDKKFRLEFNYNSNHLEGNTLTYGETELLLLFDQTKGNHELRELEEMKAHDAALMLIKEEAVEKSKPLTEKFIKDLNQIILVRPFWKDAITSEGQSTRRQIQVGVYKEHPNSVIQANGEMFEYASPQDTPIMMADLVQWYNDESGKKELAAIELAALLHYRYIRIHPFDDGNGRVARLLVNYVLYYNDLPPIIIKTADKKNYLRALQQADAGDLQAFINYMIQQLAWSLDLSIKAAKGENIEEQDDWEKQLNLLKKGLGDKNSEVVKKSDESVKAVFKDSIDPFVKLLDLKISQFDSLFMSRLTNFGWNDYSKVSYLDVNDALAKLHRELSSVADIKTYRDTYRIYLNFTFSEYRSPYSAIVIKTRTVIVSFSENAYAVRYEGIVDRIVSKLYSESLSIEEMNSIISEIGKDILKDIEKAINS